MGTAACVHFECRQCGGSKQRICIDSALAYDEPLVCPDGHNTFLSKDQTERVNDAFRFDAGLMKDVFL